MKLLTELDSLDNVKDGETRKLVTKATSSGSGNVVSSVSVSGDTVTYTKGVTALTAHQNAFSNIKVDSTTVAADKAGDTLELVAGSNVTLTPDTTNDKITIAATDTTYESKAATSDGTAVSLVTTGEKYIWNNKQNALSTQTAYSAKGSATKVPQITTNTLGQVTSISEVTITQPTVNNGTLTIQKNGTNVQTFSANQSSNATANITVPTKTSELTNDSGYTSNTGTITGISVNGTSIATSGIANITSVPASILSGAIPSAVTATTQSAGDNSTKIATTAFVKTAIDNLPDPMVFKGSLGTGGTIIALPVDGSASIGDTYKVITAGTYASKAAKVGDTFICLTKTSSANTWELIPSGDEPSGTVTSITLKATSPIAIDSSSAITTSGTRTLSHANSGVTAGTYRSVTVNATGHVTAGTNPTTLSGYGITDAKIANEVITLGNNTVTVPTKTSELTNDSHFNYSIEKASGTIDDLAAFTSGKPGLTGSISLTKKSSGIGSEIPAGWYNYYFSPHRSGVGGDNINYGTIILTPMTFSGSSYILRRSSSATTITDVKKIAIGDIPTKVSELTNDSGYTTNTGTITGITMNGASKGTSGVVDLGTVSTTDTKNTAGSTDTSSKIFLIGATSQAANPQTYSDNEIYATSGVLTTKSVQVGGTAATMQYNSTDKCIEFIFA